VRRTSCAPSSRAASGASWIASVTPPSDAGEVLRRGGSTRRRGSSFVAGARDAHRRVRWRGPLPLRSALLTGLHRAAPGRQSDLVQDLDRGAPAEALRPRRVPRRRGIAQGNEAGRLCTPQATVTRASPGGAVSIHSGHLGTSLAKISADVSPATRPEIFGEISTRYWKDRMEKVREGDLVVLRYDTKIVAVGKVIKHDSEVYRPAIEARMAHLLLP
jgi:hypothetical protein